MGLAQAQLQRQAVAQVVFQAQLATAAAAVHAGLALAVEQLDLGLGLLGQAQRGLGASLGPALAQQRAGVVEARAGLAGLGAGLQPFAVVAQFGARTPATAGDQAAAVGQFGKGGGLRAQLQRHAGALQRERLLRVVVAHGHRAQLEMLVQRPASVGAINPMLRPALGQLVAHPQ